MKDKLYVLFFLLVIASKSYAGNIIITPTQTSLHKISCNDSTVERYIADIVSKGYVTAEETTEGTSLYKLYFPANSNHSRLTGKLYINKAKGGSIASSDARSLGSNSGFLRVYAQNTKDGSYFIKAGFFLTSDKQKACLLYSNNFTVSQLPTINKLYTSPTSAQAGSEFLFYAPLSGALPSGYSVQIEWYDGGWKFRKQMIKVTSKKYYYKRTITKAGSRLFRAAIFNGNTQVSDWKTQSFTVTEVPVNHAPSVSKDSADTSAKIGETATVKVTATDPDNNLATVQINWGDSGSTAEQCKKYSGDIYRCTHSYQSTGTYTWAVTAYDHGKPVLTSNVVRGSITVQNNVPSIGTLYTNPASAQAGTSFRFFATLSSSLPSGYSLKIEWYDGDWKFRKQMAQSSSTKYYFDKSISKAGDRQFRVAVFNGNTQVSAWKSATFKVTEVPVNHAPTIFKYSADTSAKVGETITVRVTATDPDNNLATVQINWGDAGRKADLCSKYSGDIYNCTHTYQSTGTYTWAVTAYDHGKPNLTSNVVRGSITVQNNVPSIGTLYTDPASAQAGTSFRFFATLSSSLPSGYSLRIEWYDGDWKFRKQMAQSSSTKYYFDKSISKAGNRQFRVAVFNGNTQVSAWKSATFTVTEVPVNHAPTIFKYSADTSADLGQTVTVKVTATDLDNNLATVQINWGDASGDSLCSQYSGDIYECTHVYSKKTENYTWTALAYDNGTPALYSKTVTGHINVKEPSGIVAFLNIDTLISKMNLSSNLAASLSRSDAVVLVDRMRILENSTFDKDMGEYINPFADVPDDAEYLSSLMRLAYYHSSSFGLTPIDKYNELFNPLHHMTREEFLKVALTSFDIPRQSYNLSRTFSDSTEMSDWAIKYFETAAYYKIIVGNNGKLLARDKISVQEGLAVLERIKKKFGSKYPFNASNFQQANDFAIENMFRKSIGVEYEPAYYKPEATPIEITDCLQTAPTSSRNYIILTAVSNIDTANGASDYYRWETNAGYFKQHPDSPNFKKIYFYPASSEPLSDYTLYLTGWDNLSYVSHYKITISKDTFSYNEDQKAVSFSEVASSPFSFNLEEGSLTATKAASINFTEMDVEKSNIDLSVDHVVVEMDDGINKYILYSNTPNAKRATFIVPDLSALYGKDVDLTVTIYTQNVKYQKTMTVSYLPVFRLTGKVYNTGEGADAEYITFMGKEVYLDEDNMFFLEVDNSSELSEEELNVYSGSESNFFQNTTIDFTYQVPVVNTVLVGRNKTIDWDLDGVPNENDAFPYDPTETTDTDSDGIGNNADTDDDNDGMPDEYEIAYGFNPYNALDADDDFDGDGFTNLEEYQAGTNPLAKPGAGTVLYNNLMWQKTDDGIFRDWWEAKAYCDDLELDGYTDWRMPTFDELNGLVVCSNGAPTPPPKFSFLGCRDAVGDFTTPTMDPAFDAAYITSPYIGYGVYWTSTENGAQTDYVWIISFNYGQNAAVEKTEDSYFIVRCVRDL